MRKAVLIGLLMILTMSALPASAHEGREVGNYQIVFGWAVEPAFVGILNGPELTITHHEFGTPVEGLADTLQLEVQFGPQTKILTLYAVFNSPGHYMADLLPTRPGDYTFHLTGTINDMPVDEVFSSADGEFSSIEPATDIQFPEPDPLPADLMSQIEALRAEIDALKAEIEALKAE